MSLKVVYTGTAAIHRYHSTPSKKTYFFGKGIPEKILKEDEEYFLMLCEKSPSFEKVSRADSLKLATEKKAKKDTRPKRLGMMEKPLRGISPLG